MDILFEQRMQMLLKDEYQNFKTALLKTNKSILSKS